MKKINHVHDQIKGKQALELFAEVRFLNSACCESRFNYLKIQAQKYVDWVGNQDWCEDKIEYAKSVVAKIEHDLQTDWQDEFVLSKPIEDRTDLVQLVPEDNATKAFEAMDDMQGELDEVMEANVRKAYYKLYGVEGNLEFWGKLWDWANDRKVQLLRELKRQDWIQDQLDKLTQGGPNKNGRWPYAQFKALTTFKTLLDNRFKQKRIQYETWVIMVNQIHSALGWKLIQSKYEIRLTPDRIAYYELKLKEYAAKIEEGHQKIFEEKVDNSGDLLATSNEWMELKMDSEETASVLQFIEQAKLLNC